ncbi:statherin isoform X1 [Pongo pygmaeus]|uniref:Statherin n=1 Tax=Pongo abelii TaxID=9601 RepID=A0A2J8RVP8_PONAB|nr:statherin isoform X1 [Pongo abelii]PNJ12613.1 STATH isoform 3 [Pongo abelii]PNJ12614.1 STATH isoform 4 [Pongo abelii]
MKFLVFAFILALMVSMIGADSSEEKFLRRLGRYSYGYGPYQPVPEERLYPQPYPPPYQQYAF